MDKKYILLLVRMDEKAIVQISTVKEIDVGFSQELTFILDVDEKPGVPRRIPDTEVWLGPGSYGRS